MRLGYFTMPLHPPGSDLTQTLDDDLAQIIALDRLGYREAWIGEHFTAAWENIPAPDLFIAKALGVTTHIILGTGVTCLPYHHPLVLAHRIAQLDRMARGRFHWGIGSGAFAGDFEAFGIDSKSGEQRGITRDVIDTVLRLWDSPSPGVFEHARWRFNVPAPDPDIGLGLHVTPYQKPHPPIGVAGVSPKSDTLVLAGERGWIPMSINLVPVPTLQSHWAAVEDGARRTGRTPDRGSWRIAREVFIADTTAEARRLARASTMARDFRDYFFRALPKAKMLSLLKTDPAMPDSDVTIDYLIDTIWLVGSAAEVEQKIRALHRAVGGFGVLLAMGHEWQPREVWEQSMTVLARDVLPRLADLT